MKLFKNSLYIVALCTIPTIFARITKSRKSQPTKAAAAPRKRTPARTRVTPAPIKPAANTFYSFMHQIRNMNSDDVINDQGIFTDTFKNFVQATNLAPFGMEILMQAGKNLHLPLSGHSKEDIALILQTNNNITNFMAAQLGAVIPPTPTGAPQSKPIPGKPLIPQTPITGGAAQINKPIPIAQTPQLPIINPINKPEDPLRYVELIKNQFSEELKTFFVKKDNGAVEFGNQTNKFPSFVDKIVSIMLREYPQISLDDLISSVNEISLYPLPPDIINGPAFLRYIREIVTNEYNRLQQQVSPQPQPQQPQAQALPQKSISNAQLKDLVVQNLTGIDQQKSIDYLFTENSGGNFWYIKVPAFKDSEQIRLAYGDTLLLINKLVKILRDKYPDYISLKNHDTSFNVVIKAIEEGIKNFLQQKYNKKFQDYDDAIIEYLSTHDTFKKIMTQKSQ